MGYRFVRPKGSGRRVNSDSYLSGPWGLLIGVGVLVLVCMGVVHVIKNTYDHAEGDKQEAAKKGSLTGKTGTRPAPTYSSGPNNDSNRGSGFAAPPPAARDNLTKALGDLNLSVVLKEVARFKGDGGAVGRHGSMAASAAERVQATSAGQSVPEHFEPADEIVTVNGTDLLAMKPDDASAHLAKVVRQGDFNTMFRFRVKRGGFLRDLFLALPRETGLSDSLSATGRMKISNQFTLEIQKQVLSLPPTVLPMQERQEIEKILGKGEATPEEYAFLTRRMASDDAGQIERERESFTRQLGVLEKMLPTGPVADTLMTKDGRRVSGTLAGDTERAVTIETPYGKVVVNKPDVAHLYTALEIREDFNNRLTGSRDKTEALGQLLAWTRDMQMPVHREYVAYLLLQLNSENTVARVAAGYYQGPAGKWVLGTSIAAGAKPTIKQAQSRGELQPELESMGFTMHAGKWFTKQPWTSGIDTLHYAGNLKMSMSGCQIMSWHEEDTPQSRLFNPTGKPKDGAVPKLRFIAPTAGTGTVTITIEAPGEIFECHVKAVGNVIERTKLGKVECYITPEGTTTQTLYSIQDSSDELFHDVTSLTRGKKKFSVSARLTTTVDKYGTYARFLQSIPDQKEVFWVKGIILMPAPEIDKTWANTRP
jgi:hypothetical protein